MVIQVDNRGRLELEWQENKENNAWKTEEEEEEEETMHDVNSSSVVVQK